jgi:hypothetical protein
LRRSPCSPPLVELCRLLTTYLNRRAVTASSLCGGMRMHPSARFDLFISHFFCRRRPTMPLTSNFGTSKHPISIADSSTYCCFSINSITTGSDESSSTDYSGKYRWKLGFLPNGTIRTLEEPGVYKRFDPPLVQTTHRPPPTVVTVDSSYAYDSDDTETSSLSTSKW